MSGAIASSRDYAKAQIRPIISDFTLPNNSRVTTSGNTSVIEGGTQAGNNLFHSFRQFSLPTGNTAYFNNVLQIQNIISRVTGRSVSNIDGLIKANGTANLFFINPNGIIFGPNASLDIGGAFVASTASAVNFADGTSFGAKAPQTTPLLTINVPIGLQYGSNAGNIVLRGSSLSVPNGATLALVGGNLSVDSAKLLTPGGQVELGGVAGTGTVGLFVNGNAVSLSFHEPLARADVSLLNGAEVNVRADSRGSIAINAQNLNLEGGSTLKAGIASGSGSVDSKAGNIEIDAIGTITLTDTGSFISNAVLYNATGKGGDVYIRAGLLRVTRGAQIFTGTFGQGDGGNVNINVRDAAFFDGEGNTISSGAYSRVQQGAMGNGGNVNLSASSLSVTNGATLQANTGGQGNAGSVNINIRDTVSFDGEGDDFFSSGAYSLVEKGAVGNGGNVNVTTGSLSLTNGAVLSTSIRGRGYAGNVNIIARDTISFDRQSRSHGELRQSSGAFSAVLETGVGQGGNIYVTTGSLFLTNGATLLANTLGQGNAGSVNINAHDRVSFDGVGIGSDFFRSGAYSRVESSGLGHAGSVNVTTRSLSVTNGAVITTSTFGQGNAGSININVQEYVSFHGVGTNGLPSGAFSIVQPSAVGKGGDIKITTGSLAVTNGAELSAVTFGLGNGGNVAITAHDTVLLDGVAKQGFSSGLLSGSEVETASGQGGNITVRTGTLHISNGAVVSARTVNAFRGGNIIVDANNLELTGGGQILTSTYNSGRAGNITVNVTNGITISGSDLTFDTRLRQFGRPIVDPASSASGLFANTDTKSSGQGGTISLDTKQLQILDGAQVSVNSQGNGGAGNVDISAHSIHLDNHATISANTRAGQGNINLGSGDLILRRGSNITTNATGKATGGNITINTDNLVAVPKEDSDMSANAEESFGGRVIINAQGIFGTQFQLEDTPFSDITATSALGSQFSGTVQINIPDVDPSRGLTHLPNEPVDASRQIAQTCRATSTRASQQSQFVITGRGGLPPNPKEPLSKDAVQVDWVTLNPRVENRSTPAVSVPKTSATPAPLVEAQGWLMNAKGQVVLTANAPTATPQTPWQTPTNCSAPRSTPAS